MLGGWAKKHGVSQEAISELHWVLNASSTPNTKEGKGKSEAAIQTRVRLTAAEKGIVLWRNNNGACVDARGNHIRYGLANDSSRISSVMKSSDLIGYEPTLITGDMVGTLMARFTAFEVKKQGWHYTGTAREYAQLNYLLLVALAGGQAKFISNEGEL